MCNLFRKIFEFRENMNTKTNFAKSVLLIFSRNLLIACLVDYLVT